MEKNNKTFNCGVCANDIRNGNISKVEIDGTILTVHYGCGRIMQFIYRPEHHFLRYIPYCYEDVPSEKLCEIARYDVERYLGWKTPEWIDRIIPELRNAHLKDIERLKDEFIKDGEEEIKWD